MEWAYVYMRITESEKEEMIRLAKLDNRTLTSFLKKAAKEYGKQLQEEK